MTDLLAGLLQRRWPAPLNRREAAALTTVADSGVWTDGPWTAEVEARMRAITGAPEAVAFSSCTAALHATLAARGCARGSTVEAPALSFAGTVTGARHLGARLAFRDVRPGTLTIHTGPAPAGVGADRLGCVFVPVRRSGAQFSTATARRSVCAG